MDDDPLPDPPQAAGEPQLQMNATHANDPDALLRLSLGDPASTLAQRLAGTEICDHRNLLGEAWAAHMLSCTCFCI